jgi:arginine exporter protein ArgO
MKSSLLAQVNYRPIGGNLKPESLVYDYEKPAIGVSDLFSNLFSMFTFVAGIAFLIYFVIGAINWITAGGDAQKVEKAGKQITNALTGLILVVAAYSLIAIVSTVLGLDILNPESIINNLGPK